MVHLLAFYLPEDDWKWNYKQDVRNSWKPCTKSPHLSTRLQVGVIYFDGWTHCFWTLSRLENKKIISGRRAALLILIQSPPSLFCKIKVCFERQGIGVCEKRKERENTSSLLWMDLSESISSVYTPAVGTRRDWGPWRGPPRVTKEKWLPIRM